jgi:hypothetical protein
MSSVVLAGRHSDGGPAVGSVADVLRLMTSAALTGRMTVDGAAPERDPHYAMSVADSSYRWYKTAAIRSRRTHRLADLSAVVLSATIPVLAITLPSYPAITGAIGSLLAVIAGSRAIFHWQENYLRFSQAREEVDRQRRLYLVGAEPYSEPATRDQELVRAVSRIEHDEMHGWARIADPGMASELRPE